MSKEDMILARTSRSLTACTLSLVMAGTAGCSGLGPPGGAPQPGDNLVTTAEATNSGAPTADAAVRSSPVVAGRPARVFIFAGFGDHCEPVPAPQITVTQAPAKGDVSFVPDQDTLIQASSRGTCIGQKAKGTGVYYTARAGQTGSDRFAVSARLASGETATRTFEVRIAE